MWDFWWTKWRWSRFPPRNSVSPAKHSTNFSTVTITYYPGLVEYMPVVASVPKVPPHKLKNSVFLAFDDVVFPKVAAGVGSDVPL
jgi:hypothetical protein